MKKYSLVVLIATVFIMLFSVPAAANQTDYMVGDFTDIEDHWAYDQMSELIAMGILKGYTETVYDRELGNTRVQVVRPDQNVTRAEFAALLYQALNLKPEGETAPFSDKIPSWAADAVNALFKAGIVKGNPDGSFKAGNNISRAEIATMLVQALNDSSRQTGKAFRDVPSWYWAYDNIQKASAVGIINGMPDGKFVPGRSAKRGEVMVMLYRFMLDDQTMAPDNSELLSYTDNMLKAMEASINSTGPVNLSTVSRYVTGEQEAIVADSQAALNDLKQNGTVSYKVNYPGTVISKSDRLAELVYDTVSTFKTATTNLEQRSKEHYYLMKIGDRWYIYSNMDDRML